MRPLSYILGHINAALAECLAPFRVHFVQRPSAQTLARYVTGLLTEQSTTNCDTLATSVPGTTAQRLNHLLTEMVRDEADLHRPRVRQMAALPTDGDGVLQVTVNCHDAERTVAWPVATRLSRPEAWARATARRARAHVPAARPFRTTPAIALALLDDARASGVAHACVVADADYGAPPRSLPAWPPGGRGAWWPSGPTSPWRRAAPEPGSAPRQCSRRRQGSAVTGKSFRTGQRFDAGRTSDFDIALEGQTLLQKAKDLGLQLRSGGTRTGPLTKEQVEALGPGELKSALEAQAGREVNFMIFGPRGSAAAAGRVFQ